MQYDQLEIVQHRMFSAIVWKWNEAETGLLFDYKAIDQVLSQLALVWLSLEHVECLCAFVLMQLQVGILSHPSIHCLVCAASQPHCLPTPACLPASAYASIREIQRGEGSKFRLSICKAVACMLLHDSKVLAFATTPTVVWREEMVRVSRFQVGPWKSRTANDCYWAAGGG